MPRFRCPHILKGNKTTYLPKKFIFFDTETYQKTKKDGVQIHKLKLGWCCYWQRTSGNINEFTKWFYFTKPEEFWDFVEVNIHSKERIVIISHNIVFDHTIVKGWSEVIKRKWKLTRLYEKGRTFIGVYKKTSKTLLLLDNMNFFMTTVANLGKQVGLDKIDVDFSNCTIEQLSIHCKRDVEILLATWKSYLTWFKNNDLGNFGVTISAQSFNTYRHRFMPFSIFVHTRKYVIQLERDSYFGGRTECFNIGSFKGDKYYYLDINSMYPSVMKYNNFPNKYLYYDLKVNIDTVRLLLRKFAIIARVEIDTKVPIIPYRNKNKVLFPTGKFIAALCSPELELALRKNVIVKVLSMAVYSREKIFDKFIDFFYNERLKAKKVNNLAYVLFFKLLMNSLYGKFGQRMGEWVTVDKCDPEEVAYWSEVKHESKEIFHYRKINGLVQRYEKPSEAFNSFPAISAHVTSYARVKLYDLIETAGAGNVFYCDTDSLFVNQAGYDHLLNYIDNDKLGYLKVEDITNEIKIFGCKHYIFGSRDKHKGLKKEALQIGIKTFSQTQWSTLKSLIISGNTDEYLVKDIIKRFTEIYDKGIVNQDGSVLPLVLDQR